MHGKRRQPKQTVVQKQAVKQGFDRAAGFPFPFKSALSKDILIQTSDQLEEQRALQEESIRGGVAGLEVATKVHSKEPKLQETLLDAKLGEVAELEATRKAITEAP